MPELPEVITISRDLKKEVSGEKIIKVENKSDYSLNPSPDHFNSYVAGAVVEGIENIAKLITIKLSSGYYLATHLNMTGRLLFNTEDPYIKISLHFENGDKLHYSTIRMFGYFEVWDKNKFEEYKTRYGKTALDPTLKLPEFVKNIKRSNSFIKTNLLNQRFISGIGNIYANDALYMTKIHPKRRSREITDGEYKALFKNIQKILNEGLEHRGSSIDRYTDLYGKPGWHQKYFRIYGKKKGKCNECNSPITFEKIQGRGTYYCPTCQVLETKKEQEELF